MLGGGGLDVVVEGEELLVDLGEVDFGLGFGGADIAGDVEVPVVFRDFVHGDASGVAFDGVAGSFAIGLDDSGDVVGGEDVLAFCFFELFFGVDDEDIVGLFAFFEYEDADGDAGGVEEVGGEADDGVDVTVLEQFFADSGFCSASKEDAVGEDDGHDAIFFEVVEAVKEEGEIGGGFGGDAMVFEAHVLAGFVARGPAVAEGGIGDDDIEAGFFGGVGFAQPIPFVGEGVAVEDFEFGVFDSVQEHVHPREVVGGDIVFLPVEFADDSVVAQDMPAYVEEEGAGAAGEVEHAVEVFARASFGGLAIEGDDAGEDVGDALRGIKLARFFAGTGGELIEEVFVGVAEGIGVGGQVGQFVGDAGDDGAEFGVALGVGFAEFVGVEVDFGKQAGEGAGEGVVLDVFEAGGEGFEQIIVLGARQVGDVGPEVLGFDDVVDSTAHLVFEELDVARILRIPHFERRAAAVFRLGGIGIFVAQNPFDIGFVVVREIAQKEERQHVVAEVVGVHGAAQVVGDAPQGFA